MGFLGQKFEKFAFLRGESCRLGGLIEKNRILGFVEESTFFESKIEFLLGFL